MKLICFLIISFLSLACVLTYAVTVPNLYSMNIPVDSPSSTDDSTALISQAFQCVLTKVSGNPHLSKIPESRPILQHAHDYVIKYGYISPEPSSSQPYLFHVVFSERDIQQALNQLGQSVWEKDRPLILIWTILKDRQGSQLAQGDNPLAVQPLLKKHFEQRGLPYVFPILDLTDLQKLTPNSLLTLESAPLWSLSARYTPAILLVVAVDTSNNQTILTHWRLLLPQTEMRWDFTEKTLDQAISLGADQVLKTISEQFVSKTQEKNTPAQTIRLTVIGLKSFENYGQTLKYLRGLNQVAAVEANNASAGQADFTVTFQGDLEQLKRILQLSTLFKPLTINPTAWTYQFTGL